MAKLNLNKQKLINEDNLRAIISYGLGFASRVKTLEDKEIAPFEANKMYLKDSLCIYNDYIYMAKVTNQSATFNENYWTLLCDDITELSKTDIEAMLGLTTEEIETLSKIILDTEVRLDKTWSSSKIYTDIQNAIDTSKAYTLAELGKASGASYKVVSSTGDMTEQKYIYLMSNGASSYNMYIVESDGTATQIGNTSISLDNYFTKQEIEADYLKKTDADSKYATITTVDGKIDKTNIATSLDDIVIDEQVTSALLTKTELDKLSASLGEKASREEIKNFKNVHISQTTLGITIENGQDNTRKVFDALEVGERYQDCWDNSSSTSKWGIAESYGKTVLIEIVKVGLEYGVCNAMTNKGIILQRYIDTSMATMLDWQVLATVNNVTKYPDWSNQLPITQKEITLDQDVYIELNQVNSEPIGDLKINGTVVSISDASNGLYSTKFSGYVKKGSVVSYPYLTYRNFVRVFPLV